MNKGKSDAEEFGKETHPLAYRSVGASSIAHHSPPCQSTESVWSICFPNNTAAALKAWRRRTDGRHVLMIGAG